MTQRAKLGGRCVHEIMEGCNAVIPTSLCCAPQRWRLCDADGAPQHARLHSHAPGPGPDRNTTPSAQAAHISGLARPVGRAAAEAIVHRVRLTGLVLRGWAADVACTWMHVEAPGWGSPGMAALALNRQPTSNGPEHNHESGAGPSGETGARETEQGVGLGQKSEAVAIVSCAAPATARAPFTWPFAPRAYPSRHRHDPSGCDGRRRGGCGCAALLGGGPGCSGRQDERCQEGTVESNHPERWSACWAGGDAVTGTGG